MQVAYTVYARLASILTIEIGYVEAVIFVQLSWTCVSYAKQSQSCLDTMNACGIRFTSPNVSIWVVNHEYEVDTLRRCEHLLLE